MDTRYTHERNAQILIALMKEHGITKVIASPGMTNVSLVASIQADDFFEMYSCVDERSAAYMACGLAAETGEPVAISCTGATASRNYAPGLTEAYYRKLPILAITSSQPTSRAYHNVPQVTDRSAPMPDMARASFELQTVKDAEDDWDVTVKANEALLELRRHGGGPVHVNLIATYDPDFGVERLAAPRTIRRYATGMTLPAIRAKRVAVYVGAHLRWAKGLTEAVDEFCEMYDGVVLCDATSNYRGKYGVFGNIVANQSQVSSPCASPELMIHIGDVSGSYMSLRPKEVWRVNPDGEVRDTFRTLTNVFELEEVSFFRAYAKAGASRGVAKAINFFSDWKAQYEQNVGMIDEDSLPFSEAWMAWKTMPHLPDGSVLHLGILNSLRCWNYFEMPQSVLGYSNTGGFGIDGCVSSLVGASLADSDKICIGAVGDLAFFYDLNSIGNRHVGSNVRILLNNNGKGFEFKHYGSYPSTSGLAEITDPFIAAAGHFGDQSRSLVRDYAEALGFEYHAASSKAEYLDIMGHLVDPDPHGKPLVIEAFTTTDDENAAQKALNNLRTSVTGQAKQAVHGILGDSGVRALKKALGKK